MLFRLSFRHDFDGNGNEGSSKISMVVREEVKFPTALRELARNKMY